MRCWIESETSCKQGFSLQGKHGDCFDCPVFKQATKDPIILVGEQFNSMMHILEQSNIKLVKAYDELKMTQSKLLQKEKMASVGQLAAGIAHEINNPIAFVASNITTCGKYLSRLDKFIHFVEDEFLANYDQNRRKIYDEKKKKDKLDFIIKDGNELISESSEGIQRVREIVESLKGFSGIDQAEKQAVGINSCVELTLSLISNELKEKKNIRTDFSDLPLIECTPHKLNQVFLNIILNALHAIEDNGEVAIRTNCDQKNIYVVIQDTGVGISEHEMARIFEPFFTTREVGSGKGLGLSMSYDIMKEHGGEIEVESLLGKGSTFTIIIPINC